MQYTTIEALAIHWEAAAAEVEADVWEAADAMENGLLLDEAGLLELTSDYITSHCDPHSHKGHP